MRDMSVPQIRRIDFVDNAGRYNQNCSLNRLIRTQRYRPGSLALAPHNRIADEESRGDVPPAVLNRSPYATYI